MNTAFSRCKNPRPSILANSASWCFWLRAWSCWAWSIADWRFLICSSLAKSWDSSNWQCRDNVVRFVVNLVVGSINDDETLAIDLLGFYPVRLDPALNRTNTNTEMIRGLLQWYMSRHTSDNVATLSSVTEFGIKHGKLFLLLKEKAYTKLNTPKPSGKKPIHTRHRTQWPAKKNPWSGSQVKICI